MKDDWKFIALNAWSMYGYYALFLISVAQTTVTYFNNGNPAWGAAAAVISVIGMVVRLLPQPNMPNKKENK